MNSFANGRLSSLVWSGLVWLGTLARSVKESVSRRTGSKLLPFSPCPQQAVSPPGQHRALATMCSWSHGGTGPNSWPWSSATLGGKSLVACVMGIYGEASRRGRHRAPSPVTERCSRCSRPSPLEAPLLLLPSSLALPSRPGRRPTDHWWSNLEQESVRGHRPLLSVLPKSSHPTPGCCPMLPSMELVAKRHTVSEGS